MFVYFPDFQKLIFLFPLTFHRLIGQYAQLASASANSYPFIVKLYQQNFFIYF